MRAAKRRYGRSSMDAYEALALSHGALELAVEKMDEQIEAGTATFADYKESSRIR